jgi:hypothetical protein
MFFLTPRSSDPFETEGTMEYPLVKLLVFTEHKDTIRRGGIASVMKCVVRFALFKATAEHQNRNCAFQKEAHKAILSPEADRVAVPPSTVESPGINMLPYLLLPLAGPEEFDLDVSSSFPRTNLIFKSVVRNYRHKSYCRMHFNFFHQQKHANRMLSFG